MLKKSISAAILAVALAAGIFTAPANAQQQEQQTDKMQGATTMRGSTTRGDAMTGKSVRKNR